MKTLLSQFCEEFDGVVRPLLQPLTQAADTLNHVSDKAAIRSILPTVLDVRHHLATLADKVAEQQAYVLIFGPLKSGKSTLMNAISAAYVSEVTTLPAYPTMVYVSHSDKVAFTITRYNGEVEEFSDMASMRTLMEWAHNELAERIREVEARDEEFEPSVHIPQAIRRVDVRLPAPHLESSSAALVDTPGLYSRMKFGYDRMTREFRNTASCAIFVVKTDNLFLEQVFDEFGELLKLFSRIFLLVNLDSTKRDLLPDGELGPSLERSEPSRIITAFENLAMSAPLKTAAEEGRLRIYPVDLLQAASRRVQGLEGEADTDAEPEDDGVGMASFHAFQKDLTDYLNSTDYLVAFLGDSLRQAWNLIDELKGVCDEQAVEDLLGQVAKLEQERVRLEGTERSVARLAACEWKNCFGPLGEDLASIAGGRIDKLRDQTAYAIVDAIDSWFDGDGSVQSLLDGSLDPLLGQAREDLARTARGVLDTVASSATAGAQLPPDIQSDLETVGLNLGRVGKAVLKILDPAKGLGARVLEVSTAKVPVRRSFLDYLLFRSRASVRKRLFGEPYAPDKAIARVVKARRLGESGRNALQDAVEAAFDAFFDDALGHLSTDVLQLYVSGLQKGIKGELRKVKDANALRKSAVERRLRELKEVSASLDRLSAAIRDGTGLLADLSNRYGETDPELLDQPVEEYVDAGVEGDAGGAVVEIEAEAEASEEKRASA